MIFKDVKRKSLTSLAFYRANSGIREADHAVKPWNYAEIRVTPKRIKRTNGTVLTPDMAVTTAIPTTNPFNNGAKEIRETYLRLYNFDYAKACCNQNDFDYKGLD